MKQIDHFMPIFSRARTLHTTVCIHDVTPLLYRVGPRQANTFMREDCLYRGDTPGRRVKTTMIL